MTALGATQPPRALYAALMLGISVAASGCAWFVARAVGGPGEHAAVAAGIVAAASLIGLLPAVVGSAERFGVVVLGASVARLLVVLFAAAMVTMVGGQDRRPVWLGAASGAAVALFSEAALAVVILTSMQRNRLTVGGGNRPVEQESGTTC